MEKIRVNKEVAKPLNMDLYDFATPEGRRRFISEAASSVYAGTNVDGEPVLVFQQQNIGMETWTRHPAKSNWYEVIQYDPDGYQEGVTYEAVG